MDRQAILQQIVQSASEELNVLNTQNDNELQKVASYQGDVGPAPIEDMANKASEGGLLSKIAKQQEPVLTPSQEDVVNILRQESEHLVKTASVEDGELEMLLEKTAMEAGLELAELEKTAEEFGVIAAQAFLREFGIEG